MANVANICLVGGAYFNGRPVPGWADIILDNGKRLRLNEDTSFEGAILYAEKLGHNASDFRARCERWIETGKWW